MEIPSEEENRHLTPLTHLPSGGRGIVAWLEGGRQMASRLADFGIFPGVVLDVLREASTGPLLLSVRGSRLALGHGVAEKIMVRRCH